MRYSHTSAEKRWGHAHLSCIAAGSKGLQQRLGPQTQKSTQSAMLERCGMEQTEASQSQFKLRQSLEPSPHLRRTPSHITHMCTDNHTHRTHIRTAQRARSRTGGRRGLHRAGLVGGVELPCGAVAGGQRAVAAHHHPRQHYSALQSAVRCSTQGKANSSNVCYPVTKQVGPEVVLTVQVSVAVSTLAAAAPQ